MRSFLRLDNLLENADILGIRDLDSEDFFFVFVEKQAVDLEYRHRRGVERKREEPVTI